MYPTLGVRFAHTLRDLLSVIENPIRSMTNRSSVSVSEGYDAEWHDGLDHHGQNFDHETDLHTSEDDSDWLLRKLSLTRIVEDSPLKDGPFGHDFTPFM